MWNANIQLIIQDYENYYQKTMYIYKYNLNKRYHTIQYINKYIYILTSYVYNITLPSDHHLPNFHFSFPGYLIGDAATIPNSPGADRLLGACEQDHSGALAYPTGPQGLPGFQVWRFSSWDPLPTENVRILVVTVLGGWVHIQPLYKNLGQFSSKCRHVCVYISWTQLNQVRLRIPYQDY